MIVDYTSSHNVKYSVEILVWETRTTKAKSIIKQFPNRTNALKFAKDYMKKY